jgi:predicted AlkP superfamily pyrophosphatase or phosphodiesterase
MKTLHYRHAMHRSVVVVSIDGLSTADLPHLESLANFRRLMEHGSVCREMRGIYPTQTYPLHASVITGCYPHRHGINANTLFQPGRTSPDWHWYRRFLRVAALDEVARRHGLKTATLLWPGAARSGNHYVIPEIKVTLPGQCYPWLLFTGGSPLFMLHMGLRYRSLLKNLQYFHLDNFTTAVASRLVRKRKTNLLLLHLLDLDGTRHRFGFRAEETQKVLEDHDRRLGTLWAAARDSGALDDTTFVVFGDHAYMDVHTRIRINAAFLKAGLLEFEPEQSAQGRRGPRSTAGRHSAQGRRLNRWEAWANTCDGSAQVSLRDPADRSVHNRLAVVFSELQKGSSAVIETVYPRDQVRRMKLGESIDYVLEAKAGCYFVPEIEGQVLAPAKENFRSVHGYHPDRPGYTSVFIAAGSGVRRGIDLDSLCIVDLGPTLAALLGLELPAAQGRVLREILDFD